jgi:hypothetical protein
MHFIQYIGGPWDQHRVARQHEPEREVCVRELLPMDLSVSSSDSVMVEAPPLHRYRTHRLGRDRRGGAYMYIAISEDVNQ